MLERISEPISNYFIRRVNTRNDIILFNFFEESNLLKTKIPGTNFNFNYEIRHLVVAYTLPSLAVKPFQEYKITDSETQRRIADIEFARNYNHLTTNSNGDRYASLLILRIKNLLTYKSESLGEILLYNSTNNELSLPLMQYLRVPIVSENCLLEITCPYFKEVDKIVISGSYVGNVNYTFDSGAQSHIFP